MYSIKLQSVCFIENDNDSKSLSINDGKVKISRDDGKTNYFRFDKCYIASPDSNDNQIAFNESNIFQTILPSIRMLLFGFNSSIWMMSTNPSLSEMKESLFLNRVFTSLFEEIEEQSYTNTTQNYIISSNISTTCFEIYDTKIKDLLQSATSTKTTTKPTNKQSIPASTPIRLREMPDTGTYVDGLTSVPVCTIEECSILINRILKNRSYLVTGIDPNVIANANNNVSVAVTDINPDQSTSCTTNELTNANGIINTNGSTKQQKLPSSSKITTTTSSSAFKRTNSTLVSDMTTTTTTTTVPLPVVAVPGSTPPTMVVGAVTHVFVNIQVCITLQSQNKKEIIERRAILQLVLFASAEVYKRHIKSDEISSIMTRKEYDSRKSPFFSSDGIYLSKENLSNATSATVAIFHVANLRQSMKSLSTLTRVVKKLLERSTSSSSSITSNTSASKDIIGSSTVASVVQLSNHIPYRDHIITRLLQPSLSRNCAMSLILSIHGDDESAIQLLRFASSMGDLRNTVTTSFEKTKTEDESEETEYYSNSSTDNVTPSSPSLSSWHRSRKAYANSLMEGIAADMGLLGMSLDAVEESRLQTMRELGLQIDVIHSTTARKQIHVDNITNVTGSIGGGMAARLRAVTVENGIENVTDNISDNRDDNDMSNKMDPSNGIGIGIEGEIRSNNEMHVSPGIVHTKDDDDEVVVCTINSSLSSLHTNTTTTINNNSYGKKSTDETTTANNDNDNDNNNNYTDNITSPPVTTIAIPTTLTTTTTTMTIPIKSSQLSTLPFLPKNRNVSTNTNTKMSIQKSGIKTSTRISSDK
eukprot:gene11638-24371_t